MSNILQLGLVIVCFTLSCLYLLACSPDHCQAPESDVMAMSVVISATVMVLPPPVTMLDPCPGHQQEVSGGDHTPELGGQRPHAAHPVS